MIDIVLCVYHTCFVRSVKAERHWWSRNVCVCEIAKLTWGVNKWVIIKKWILIIIDSYKCSLVQGLWNFETIKSEIHLVFTKSMDGHNVTRIQDIIFMPTVRWWELCNIFFMNDGIFQGLWNFRENLFCYIPSPQDEWN